MDQELIQYLDGRFNEMEGRFEGRFFEVYERLDEAKRHNGVLIEGLRHELHLVADGLLMHVEVRHREDRDYFDGKFEDMATLFRSSHDHLQQQQDQLRQRMENLERNRPQ